MNPLWRNNNLFFHLVFLYTFTYLLSLSIFAEQQYLDLSNYEEGGIIIIKYLPYQLNKCSIENRVHHFLKTCKTTFHPRQLVWSNTYTCPSYVTPFPLVFAMDQSYSSQCAADITIYGFDVSSSSQMIVCGAVSGGASSGACPFLTTDATGGGFISLLNANGIVLWSLSPTSPIYSTGTLFIKFSVFNSAGTSIYSITSNNANMYISIYSATSGTAQYEVQVNGWGSTYTGQMGAQSAKVDSSGVIYIVFKSLLPSFYGNPSQGGAAAIAALDSTLTVLWFKAQLGYSTCAMFADVYVQLTNYVYTLGFFDVSDGTYSYNLHQIEKSSGIFDWQIQSKQTTNLLIPNGGAIVTITTDSTTLIAVTCIQTSTMTYLPYFLMFYGTNFQSTYSVWMTNTGTSGTYVASGYSAQLDGDNQLIAMYNIGFKLTNYFASIAFKYYICRGSTSVAGTQIFSTSQNANLYFAYSKLNYVSNINQIRGAIFSLPTVISSYLTFDPNVGNCAVFTSGFVYGQALGTRYTLTMTTITSPTTISPITPFGVSVSTGQYSSQYSTPPMAFQDVNDSPYCYLPLVPATTVYQAYYLGSTSATFTIPTKTYCNGLTGVTFTTSSFLFSNGSADTTGVFSYSNSNQQFSITLGTTQFGHVQNYDALVNYEVATYTATVPFHARIVIRPASSSLYDYTNPVSLTTANCLDKIYPFVQGVTFLRQVNAALADNYGNHLLCGLETTHSLSTYAVPVIAKLNRGDGSVVYMRQVPIDQSGGSPTQLFANIIPIKSGASIQAFYRYKYTLSGTNYYTFAAIQFDEATFTQTYLNVYYTIVDFTTLGAYSMNFITDETNNQFFGVHQGVSTDGLYIFSATLSTGALLLKNNLQNSAKSSYGMYSIGIVNYSTTQFVVAFYEEISTYSEVGICILNKVDLTASAYSQLQLSSTAYPVYSVVVTVDSASPPNIYVTAGSSEILIIKLTSTLTMVTKKILEATFHTIFPVGISFTPLNQIVIYAYGQINSTDLSTAMIFMSDTSLNFATYSCFEIPSFLTTDTRYSSYSTSSPTSTITNMASLQPATGYIYYNPQINISPVSEVWGVVGRSYSWGSNALKYQVYNGFYNQYFNSYPNANVQCNSISRKLGLFSDPNVYEFTYNTGTQSIFFSNPTTTQCQNRVVSYQLLNANTFTSTSTLTAVTFANNGIYVNTNLYALFSMRMMFVDVRYIFMSSTTYMDNFVQIRVLDGNITTSTGSNLNMCRFHTMPFIYGAGPSSSTQIYTITVNSNDKNIVIGGLSNNLTATAGEGGDALIMRIQTTGYIEWMNYVNVGALSTNELIRSVGIDPTGGAVYAAFERIDSSPYTYALLKLTYVEGKLIWSKRVALPQNRPTGALMTYNTAAVNIMMDWANTASFMLSEDIASDFQVPSFTQVTDNGVDLIVNFQVQANKYGGTYYYPGPALYHPTLSFTYISALAYDASHGYPFLAKIVKSTGAFVWGGCYTTSRKPNYNYVKIAYSPANNYLYLTWTTSSMLVIYQINEATGTFIQGKTISDNWQNVEIFADQGTGNIIVCGQFSAQANWYLLDSSFNIFKSYQHTGTYFASTVRLGYQVGSNIYFTYSSSASYYNSQLSAIVGMMPVDLSTEAYLCNYYFAYSSAALVAETTSQVVQTASQAITVVTGLSVVDAPEPIVTMIQKYKAIYYPMGETLNTYMAPFASTYCQAINPPTPIDLPAIECVMGNTCTYTINLAAITNCQGFAASTTIYSIFDENGNASPAKNYISWTGTTVTVHTASPTYIVYPGYRALMVLVKTQGFETYSTYVNLPLQIWPANFVPAVDAVTTRTIACANGTEWPKVWQSPTEQIFSYTFDVDQNNGNMIIGGSNSKIVTKDYPQTSRNALLVFLNNLGDMIWGYTYQMLSASGSATYNYRTLFAIFGADGYIYSAIYRENTAMFIVKQNYTHGAYVWSRRMNSSQTYVNYIAYMVQDPTTYALYFSTSASSIDFNLLYRIDPTTNPPTQTYYSFTTYDPGNNENYWSMALVTNSTTGYTSLYTYFIMYNVQMGPAYPTINRIAPGNGTLISMKNFQTSMNMYYYNFQLGMTTDSNGYLYCSYNYYASPYNVFYFYQLDSNVNITQSKTSQTFQLEPYYLSDMVVDNERSILFASFGYYYGRVILYGLSTVNLTTVYLYMQNNFNTNRQIYQLRMGFYGDYLYIMTDVTYVTSSYEQMMIQRVHYDLNFQDNCDGMTRIGEYSTASAANTLIDYTSYALANAKYFYVTTNFVLEQNPYFYAELFTYTNPQTTWTYTVPNYCSNSDIYFPVALTPQTVNVSSGVQVIAIQHATSCKGYTLIPSMVIDFFATNPSFITYTTNTTHMLISVDPGTTSSETGLYTIRLTYTDSASSSIYLTDTFELQIYPATPYGITASTCQLDVWPLIFGIEGVSNYQPISGDIDNYGENVLICGNLPTNTLTTINQPGGFLMEKNVILQTNYMYAFTTSTTGTSMKSCRYAEGSNYVAVSWGKDINSVAIRNNIYKFQSVTGYYINGKTFGTTASTSLEVDSLAVSNVTGDIYIGGQSYLNDLRFSSGSTIPFGFLMKLDLNFNFLWYTTMDNNIGYSPFFSIPSISPDNINNQFVYTSFQFLLYGPYNFVSAGYMAFDMKSGQYLNNLYNNYNYYTMDLPSLANGIGIAASYDNTGVYFAANYYHDAGTYGQQVSIFKFSKYTSSSSPGSYMYYYEINPCCNQVWEIDIMQASNLKVIVAAFSQYYTFFYRFSSTLVIDTTAQIAYYDTQIQMQRGYLRLARDYNGLYYAFVSNPAYSSYKASLMVTRLQATGTTLSLKDNCGSYYTIYGNEIGSAGYNQLTYGSWTTLGFTSSGNYPSTSVSPYLTNIQYSFMKYYDNSTAPDQLGYRGTQASGCSSIATPDTIAQVNMTQPVSYNLGEFTINYPNQCQQFYYQTQATFANGSALPSFISYDNTAGDFLIDSSSNAYVGNYSIKVSYYTPLNQWYNSSTFWINITYNHAPFMNPGFSTNITIYADHDWSQVYSMDYDIELDLPIFEAFIYYSTNGTIVTPQPSWFVVDNTSITDAVNVSVVGPLNIWAGHYYIVVLLGDGFNLNPTNNTFVNFTIVYNKAPTNITTFVKTFQTTLPWPYNYTLNTTVFNDTEGDPILITCTTTTTATANDVTWNNYYYNAASHNLTFYGTAPLSNTYAGIYNISCNVFDPYDAPPNVFYFTLTVYPKNQTHIIYNVTNQYTRVPDDLIIYANGTYSDDQGQAVSLSININGTALGVNYASWITWNPTTFQFLVTPKCNCDGGNHTVNIIFSDGISTPTTMTFILQIMQDWPLVYNVSYAVNNIGVVVMNSKSVYYNKNWLFTNPEGLPFTMYYALQGELPLKSFMYDLGNGTLSIVSTSFDDVGSQNVEIVGVDDAGWLTVIPFLVIIEPCYYTCTLCWDSNYNTCNQCIDNYYLLYASECVQQCVAGTFGQIISNVGVCTSCPLGCATCTGSNAYTQCPTCSKGYFALNNGCYASCPAPYWNDLNTYTCQPCNIACNDCYGPSSTQCRNCTETYTTNGLGQYVKYGYLLQGTSCKVPKCSEGQYFQWDSNLTNGVNYGECYNCNSTCKTCAGPTGGECVTCQLGLQLRNYYCLTCEQLPEGGYFTNAQYACQDICGDGLIRNSNQCDDNNTVSGDGCSSTCTLEYGYTCNINGTTKCIYTIQPTFSITEVSSINAVTVKFSSVINLVYNTTLTVTNVVVNVTGPLSPYTYTWRFTLDQDKPLVTGYNITQFQIILENFEESLAGDGSELVYVSFQDYTQIYDIVHKNTLANNPASSSLQAYTYISASAQSAIDGGGATLKYTLLSVFGFQLILKLILSSSMSYLWSFLNALQIISILLYLNIDFPDNVISFVNYLQFSNSGIPELTNYIPDTSAYLIDSSAIELTYYYDELPAKFNEMGVEIFFLVSYGRSISINFAIIFIAIPFLLALNQLCSKVTLWEEILGSFFFNGPLRTLITMYLSVVFQIIINSQYISFSNYNQGMASAICIVVGYVFVYMPFGFMSLIYNNRRDLRKNTWTQRFGMLTDELKTQDILQLYYYPLFMYQRLVIAAIIVFLQSYPSIQCFGVLACNVAMISYFIIVRPFKEENQQTMTVINEIIVMVCIGLYLVLIYIPDLTATQRTNVGWMIVVVIVLDAVGNFVVVIYFGAQKLQRKIRDMFGEEDYQEDSPNTSGNSDTLGSEEEEEEEPGKESWRVPGMKSDQQLIQQMQRANQVWRPSEVMVVNPNERGSQYNNPYPTMIQVAPLQRIDDMSPAKRMEETFVSIPGQMT